MRVVGSSRAMLRGAAKSRLVRGGFASKANAVERHCAVVLERRRGLFGSAAQAGESETDQGEGGRGKSGLTSYVREETDALMQQVLLPVNVKHLGPLEAEADQRTPLPFVFLLGNHSSGKSSFINHVLERRVQNTGVAPTDDGFTFIAPGPKDLDQAGPSVIGDPDMGFGGLRSFGPALIHHTQLKIRSDLAVDDIIIVDSPGMIDSPTDSISYVGAGKGRNDRGYDFEGVTRWFAERADVILLFFDPDKPGTTGETLSVLTNSLAGLDHKLHIVLNKVDQFKKIHDFARAYGSLCWNLSKVIPRKDLPRIYTMYTPVTMDKGNAGKSVELKEVSPEDFNSITADLSWKSSLEDLETTRQDVIDEVRRAPDRRIDNMITHLYDSARLLRMHLVMSEAVRLDYDFQRRRILTTTLGVGIGGNSVSLLALYLMPSVWSFAAVLSASSLAGAAGVYLYGNVQLEAKAKEMASDAFLEALFQRIFVREIAERDEFVLSLWHRVKMQLKSTIDTVGVPNLTRVAAGDLHQLEAIVDEEVPRLRRTAAPQFHNQN
eukprot:CAMPEP_0184548036 /NCGR_PEP_ID=MMETSP0199_2-20130426/5954_1 /TAXON_ID=1112570 /ORGANISM="Thraustochytrium sp., Strain LLF1b" /LENGTH=548 /DNA_ID=CAMNT_0026942605 /DNA_START=41 /DNA_END=1687 /DNA_ORIENTATION=-